MSEKKQMGLRIRAARNRLGLTQQQVADKIPGAIFSRISNYERGDREPDIATIKALAEILDVSVQYLIGISDIDELPKDEQALVLKYRNADASGKETIHRVADITSPQYMGEQATKAS